VGGIVRRGVGGCVVPDLEDGRGKNSRGQNNFLARRSYLLVPALRATLSRPVGIRRANFEI
jgi:hypothetical protein